MSITPRNLSRRSFAQLGAAICLLGRRLLRASDMGALTWQAQPDLGAGSERRYRADAQVLLLGVAFLHRNNVGDGLAAWREVTHPDGTSLKMLEFAGRSAPERAAGLNRFGLIRELSRNTGQTRTEAIYFGLMTSSPEESAAEARKALHSDSKDAWYSAIEGHIAPGGLETANARFQAASRTSEAERKELIERAEQALRTAPKRSVQTPPTGNALPPFLHALAEMLNQPAITESRYAYNGRFYKMKVERSKDLKSASSFREQKLISATTLVTRISGMLIREGAGKVAEFRLWVEDGAHPPLPLRIEYQPKSYLRLTFEALR